jgi:hypothetical protein
MGTLDTCMVGMLDPGIDSGRVGLTEGSLGGGELEMVRSEEGVVCCLPGSEASAGCL